MKTWSRRSFLKSSVAAGAALAMGRFVTGCGPALATGVTRPQLTQLSGSVIDLQIAAMRLRVAGRYAHATTINAGIPGPELRLKEGQEVTLRVHNGLREDSSIHWHGLLLPPEMDGVPGVSFKGIEPGTTFEYRFPIRQSGTYWYHSHSGFQEQTGIFGPLIIDPKEPGAHRYNRDVTIVLSDWTYENPYRILSNLKGYAGYYNYQRRTLENLEAEGEEMGGKAAIADRFAWDQMRMDSTDISDVTGATYTYLMNGRSPDERWTTPFSKGERLRLRFINASAATFFDVRIPGLPMTVIQTDGVDVEPIETDEFRVAVAETVDVLVEPTHRAHTIFAEAMDRSGFACGLLASEPGATALIPERRKRPLLTMDDMGMDHGSGGHGGHGAPSAPSGHGAGATSKTHAPAGAVTAPSSADRHAGHTSGATPSKAAGEASAHAAHGASETPVAECAAAVAVIGRHERKGHGAGNSMVAEVARSRVAEPGVGLRDAPWRVLTYSQLRRAHAGPVQPPPSREIVLHLTGNMERYMWSFDGVQYYPEMPDIELEKGERVRFVLWNDTMMAHPIHLHGMFFELEVGACERNPLKHTVNVQPAERTSFLVTAEEVGRWAFHCHILYHMEAGMFRVVRVLP